MKQYYFNGTAYEDLNDALNESLDNGYFGDSEFENFLESQYNVLSLFIEFTQNKYAVDTIDEDAISWWYDQAYKLDRLEDYEELELMYGIKVEEVEEEGEEE